jgi:hypothetical protein
MTYLRRLLTKSRAAAPRLTARRLPQFAATETRIEEMDEDVLVSSPTRSQTKYRDDPAPAAGIRRFTASPAVIPEPVPVQPDAAGSAPLSAEPQKAVPEKAGEVQPDRGRARRPQRIVVEHRRYTMHARPEAGPETHDDEPLVAVAEHSRGTAPRAIAPRAAEPLVREMPAVQRASADVTSSTVVNVVIGRIDVRALSAVPSKESRDEAFRPRMSLDEYLARGGGSS